ncbi:MAG: TIM barrel protein [Candidatus Thermoplasmatota archaeon]|nr:TIM barrel protein [Candidatus Thermoplasmatota archaeon]
MHAQASDVIVLRLGVMVSLRDYARIEVPGSDFSELLLFEGDLDRIDDKLSAEIKALWPPVEFVHAQEFMDFRGRRELVDLSSDDDGIRARSVGLVSEARDLARRLGPVPVVIHPGGIRHTIEDRERPAANLEESLRELGPSLLLLENMPWFYWLHKTDRMVSNLCVSVEDMERFVGLVDGLTLDICHGYLSKPEGDSGYCQRFMGRLGSAVKHLHASDAEAPDKEGLQIGEGEIDFSWLVGSDLPTVVEIWNGHENGGAGFRKGVERLRQMESCD